MYLLSYYPLLKECCVLLLINAFSFMTWVRMMKKNISKRLICYNEEIVDLKFLGEEEKFLTVATNLEQV